MNYVVYIKISTLDIMNVQINTKKGFTIGATIWHIKRFSVAQIYCDISGLIFLLLFYLTT